MSMATRLEMLQAALLSIAVYADAGYCVRPSKKKLEARLGEIKRLANRVLEEVTGLPTPAAREASDGSQ